MRLRKGKEVIKVYKVLSRKLRGVAGNKILINTIWMISENLLISSVCYLLHHMLRVMLVREFMDKLFLQQHFFKSSR